MVTIVRGNAFTLRIPLTVIRTAADGTQIEEAWLPTEELRAYAISAARRTSLAVTVEGSTLVSAVPSDHLITGTYDIEVTDRNVRSRRQNQIRIVETTDQAEQIIPPTDFAIEAVVLSQTSFSDTTHSAGSTGGGGEGIDNVARQMANAASTAATEAKQIAETANTNATEALTQTEGIGEDVEELKIRVGYLELTGGGGGTGEGGSGSGIDTTARETAEEAKATATEALNTAAEAKGNAETAVDIAETAIANAATAAERAQQALDRPIEDITAREATEQNAENIALLAERVETLENAEDSDTDSGADDTSDIEARAIGSFRETSDEYYTNYQPLNLNGQAIDAKPIRVPRDIASELNDREFSCVMFDDAIEFNDTMNITNMENGTIGEYFTPSGHFLAVTERAHVYEARYDSETKVMHCRQLSDRNYGYYADGSVFDPTDAAGENYDVMKLLPEYWYKGVNDMKNQRKYFFISSLDREPRSTANNIRRAALSTLLTETNAAVLIDAATGGTHSTTYSPTNNVYTFEVEGMKQVRFPGVNSDTLGAVFLDAENKVVSTFNMHVTHEYFDFIDGQYVFCDIPEGAKSIAFTAPAGYDTEEAIAVDSTEIEAIEPDWVHTRKRLVGVYGLTVDAQGMPRSISGKVTTRGNGKQVTSTEWTYDSDGNPTNTTPPSTLNYTMADFINLCHLRGEGYQSIDYEMSKDIANLAYATVGDRDIQAQCGVGSQYGYTTGTLNKYGNITRHPDNLSAQTGNLILGLQYFVACNYEWMDNVVENAPSFTKYKQDQYPTATNVSGYPIDAVWHLYDPTTKTERAVQGAGERNGYCIARVRFGKYCDVIASRVSKLNQFVSHYADGQNYTAQTARAVLRSGFNANAFGGLAYAHANYASSYSSSYCGARLAFQGEIEIA